MTRLFRSLGRRLSAADVDSIARQEGRGWLKLPPGRSEDVSVKPRAYLPVYEELLAPLRGTPARILELGVWKGDSLVMWRDAFPEATIIGLDLAPPPIDLGPRAYIVTGDQTDAALLAALAAQHAPQGFDVIIDDASHIGQLSARSLQALYAAHLRPGGLYIIEDWGTGYMTSWPDGDIVTDTVGASTLDFCPGPANDGSGAQRMPSHESGLVGLIKRLVDHTASGTLSVHQPDAIDDPLEIEWMRIHDGLVILKKPD